MMNKQILFFCNRRNQKIMKFVCTKHSILEEEILNENWLKRNPLRLTGLTYFILENTELNEILLMLFLLFMVKAFNIFF